jgi:hypothetical protein
MTYGDEPARYVDGDTTADVGLTALGSRAALAGCAKVAIRARF